MDREPGGKAGAYGSKEVPVSSAADLAAAPAALRPFKLLAKASVTARFSPWRSTVSSFLQKAWLGTLVLMLCAVVFAGSAKAQTLVSGTIAASTRWTSGGSPYVLSGSVALGENAVLTIDPGVVVYMAQGAELRVELGKVFAQGEAARPIKITSEKVRSGTAPAAGDWGQVVIGPGGSASSFKFTEISYGRGLTVKGATVTLDNVSLSGHSGAAISVDLTANLSGSGNQAAGNGLNGVLMPAGDVDGTTRFGLRGIPYVVKTGVLSVGSSPTIDSVTPDSILAGESATVTLTGRRLACATAPKLSLAGLTTQLLAGATATSIKLQVDAAITAAAGSVDLTLLTDAGETIKTALGGVGSSCLAFVLACHTPTLLSHIA